MAGSPSEAGGLPAAVLGGRVLRPYLQYDGIVFSECVQAIHVAGLNG